MLAGSTDDDSLAVIARKTKTLRPKILKDYFTQSKIFIFGILMVPKAPRFAKIHEKFGCYSPFLLRSVLDGKWRPVTSLTSFWVKIPGILYIPQLNPGKWRLTCTG